MIPWLLSTVAIAAPSSAVSPGGGPYEIPALRLEMTPPLVSGAVPTVRLPLGLLPQLMPSHSPDAGVWAWVVGGLVGAGVGVGVGYAVGKNTNTGKGVAVGVGVGALCVVLTTVVMYVVLEM